MVTANKALLAQHGGSSRALAEDEGLALKFEAAVAGGIPIVKMLRESLIAHGVLAVRGILNGTCNYILTEMEATGRAFAEVLKEAQALGYAEADPTLDVGGGDTAHKLALLASLAFGIAPDLDSMTVEGIEHITPDDIALCARVRLSHQASGHRAANARQRHRSAGASGHGARAARRSADVDGAFNAVVVERARPARFSSKAAARAQRRPPRPSSPTSSTLRAATSAGVRRARAASAGAADAGAERQRLPSAFYLRFEVLDRAGRARGNRRPSGAVAAFRSKA